MANRYCLLLHLIFYSCVSFVNFHYCCSFLKKKTASKRYPLKTILERCSGLPVFYRYIYTLVKINLVKGMKFGLAIKHFNEQVIVSKAEKGELILFNKKESGRSDLSTTMVAFPTTDLLVEIQNCAAQHFDRGCGWNFKATTLLYTPSGCSVMKDLVTINGEPGWLAGKVNYFEMKGYGFGSCLGFGRSIFCGRFLDLIDSADNFAPQKVRS